MNENSELRFDFTLYINNKIICQKYFNLFGYNEEKDPYVLRDMMNDIAGLSKDEIGSMGVIPKYLKDKSDDYLWKFYDPYVKQKTEDIYYKNIYERNDMFQFELRDNGVPIATSSFNGSVFPPKIKYDVHISEIIPDIMKIIYTYLTSSQTTKPRNKKTANSGR